MMEMFLHFFTAKQSVLRLEHISFKLNYIISGFLKNRFGIKKKTAKETLPLQNT
jgi:hypothetical protein